MIHWISVDIYCIRYFLLSLNVTNILSFLIWYLNSYTSIEQWKDNRIQYKQQYIYWLGINHNLFPVCLLFVIAHFLTGHYLAKLFIPLQTINPFPRNDIAQCIIGFSRSLLSETIDWIHFIPLSIIWWWRETNRNQPRVSNNSTKTVKKQKRWMFSVLRKKSLTDTYYMSGALWSSESGHWSPVIPGDTPLNSLPWERLVFCQYNEKV